MKGPSKKSLSNRVRLESLHERKELEAKTKLLIKASLSNLDQGNKTNKHIKFDDDDSSDGAEDREQFDNAKNLIKVSSVEDILGLDKDSSDDEIQIKQQFEGKAGKKLLEIQARTGMDNRFKMDERFVESDSDTDEKKSLVNKALDHTDEKQRNLAILQQVVGVAATTKTLKRKTTTFVDPDTKRYDPTKEGHAQLEIKPTSVIVEKKKKKKRKKEDKPVPVDSSKFYETSITELKSAFGKTQQEEKANDAEDIEKNDGDAQPFSFLKMLGRAPEEDESSDDEQLPYIHEDLPRRNEKQKLGEQFGKKIFKHDSSDSELEEDEKMEEEHKLEIETCPQTRHKIECVTIYQGIPESPATQPNTLFMLSGNDPRLLDGPRLFCSCKSIDEIREEWLECKDDLKADYKKKHRNASKLFNRGRNRKPGSFDDQ